MRGFDMTVLGDLLEDITEIEGTYGNARIEWTEDAMTGDCQPVIVWNENMRFPTQRLREGESFNLDTLPDRAEEVLRECWEGSDFNVSVQWSDMDDETEEVDGEEVSYRWLEIQVWPVLNHALDQDKDEAMGLLWPAIATLFNVTDPGTWNCWYLFDEVTDVTDIR